MKYSENFTHQHAIGKSAWHIEWCTKYRYKVFKSEYHKNICVIALEEAAKRFRVAILEMEVQPEHIHMVAEIPLTMAPLNAVRGMKSISARIIFAVMPNLRLRYPKGSVWSSGKFALSVGNITLDKAKEYVKNQAVHHSRIRVNFLMGILARDSESRVDPQVEGLPRGGGQHFVMVLVIL